MKSLTQVGLTNQVCYSTLTSKSNIPDNINGSTEETVSPPVVTGVKRSRQRSSSRSRTEAPVKRLKLTFRHQRGWGQVLTVGQGDTGQLGLGEDVKEKMRPAPVPEITEAVDAVAGGMHTAVLDRFLDDISFYCLTVFVKQARSSLDLWLQ